MGRTLQIIQGGRGNGKTCYQKILNDLNKKYLKALDILLEIYGPPCEMITKGEEFMNSDIDRCMTACGMEDEVLKECWNRYIESELGNDKERDISKN